MEMSIEMKRAVRMMYFLICEGESDCPEYPDCVNDCGDFDIIIRRYESGNVKSAVFEDGNYSVSIKPVMDGEIVVGFKVNVWCGNDKVSFLNPDMTLADGKLLVSEVCEGWSKKYAF